MLIDPPLADASAQAVGSIAIAGVVSGAAALEPVAYASASVVPVPVGPRPTAPPPVHVMEPEHDVTEFPIQPAKVQRPTLRETTLRRDRLLDWLHAKIHHRVVFVTADAGYGKTTLLADFARRTRLRTLWYRLDEEDADWISVLNYLVAAGRAVEPGFAPTTREVLRDIGSGSRTRDAIVDTFIRELAALGGSGAVLILDDYHLVDHSPDVRSLMREIVARAPERLTLVFSARRRPTIPIARLRALGELVELRTAELRFDDGETERLFRDAYGTALEPDVLADLYRRTEGWAASLQLVQTAIRDRSTSEIRAFVRSLSGAQTELHDYLAEEVVGDLDPELQSFLMATSILQSVEPGLAAVAAGVDIERAGQLADEAAGLGLLPLHRHRDTPRYHPLVRDFLEARLRRETGPNYVADLHVRLARAAEADAWRIATHHYLAAGDLASVHRVLASSTRAILSGGEFAHAETYIDAVAALPPDPSFDMIRSRMDLHRDHVPLAVERARAAVAAFPSDSADPQAHLALANLMSVEFHAGNLDVTLKIATDLSGRTTDPALAAIAAATLQILLFSTDGKLPEYEERMHRALRTQTGEGSLYHSGITLLNLSLAARTRGAASEAYEYADRAIDALSRSSAGHELPAAYLARAWAVAHVHGIDAALGDIASALASPFRLGREVNLTEAADIHDWYGSSEIASALLVDAAAVDQTVTDIWRVSRAQNLIRLRRYQEADALLAMSSLDSLTQEPGHKSRHLFVRALLAFFQDDPGAEEYATVATEHARLQGARLWERLASILLAAGRGSQELSEAVRRALSEDQGGVNPLAEVLASRLDRLSIPVRERIAEEARLRPDRWREPLRLAVRTAGEADALAAGRLLDEVGTVEDVPILRRLAKRSSEALARQLGTGLAMRLAPHAFIEDQNRVSLRVGSRTVPGTSVRRKVLALLCFLLSRRDMSATRDQVMDALWPDTEPDVAGNSLNQTVYFLRRVFEPAFRDDVSAPYVHHHSDVLWLEPQLVDSRTRLCRRLIDRAGQDPSAENVDELASAYRGRFALDFAYEEWAADYRDALHAAYLEVVESAIASDTSLGEYSRAIAIARKAIDVDPDADHLELGLLRLYKRTGAHAAAAEQYGHYSATLREQLGVDPPPLESL